MLYYITKSVNIRQRFIPHQVAISTFKNVSDPKKEYVESYK